VPRNPRGPGQQTIPGSGKAGYRLPDLKFKGPKGSLVKRGSLIEVKASTGDDFKELSGQSRKQVKDEIAFVLKVRTKAANVKNPALRTLLQKAHVEVFSDLREPTKGPFATLIEDKVLVWRRIPRQGKAGTTDVVRRTYLGVGGKLGSGVFKNIGLGLIISIVEGDISNAVYRESAAMLNDLLRQIAHNGDATEKDWLEINDKLLDIINMKQSVLGFMWELLSYGQGSVVEKQAIAMMQLADTLGNRFGYHNKKSWGDIFSGSLGNYEKLAK